MICLLGLVTANVSWAQDQPGKGKAGQDKTGQPASGVGRSGQVGEPKQGKIGQPDQGVGRSGQVKDGRTDAGGPGRDQTRPSGQNSTATGDEQIAAILYACDRNQVELARFAKDRLKSDEAREFADMMMKDHKMSMEKLQKLAGMSATDPTGTRSRKDAAAGREDGTTGRTESTDSAKTRTADKTARVATEASASRSGRETLGEQLNWVQIHNQMADQCLASTKAELERHEGENFDKAYIGQQLGAHMAMVDHLKVFKNHASEKLSGQLDACLEATTSHLDHARQIMEEQKKEGSSEPSSNRENREDRKENRKEKSSN